MSMSRLITITLILAAAAYAAAKEQTLQELIVRANAAPLKEQPGLFIDVAERQLKSADELYGEGKVDDARAAIADVVTYSQRAHDAAVQSGKKLKQTEMASRKMSRRLRDLKRTLNFDDQAPVQTAADRLESLAQDLLSHMFGKEK
jgi:polyhydroxyalkanoate synthesis regulator phasin